ncbi:hypothetical protein K435DRAFT_775049 [Dendrothele bispora CBS 962.96]|uniref:Thioesterase domain-containing protein n=1 Tax=Dendrothele bispora (strain CBS 962.96) TaxID=1314807 RepID=A0A4S8MKY0_DENBC|nr:hypothetical protein K435DRAFT_775049 [Dendrothele bispora CBS 962.96]
MPDLDISRISGNAPDEIKQALGDPTSFFNIYADGRLKQSFGYTIMERLEVVEIDIVSKAEEPSRKEGRVVCQVVIDEDMLNGGGNLHGGCSAFLVDVCTTFALSALGLATMNDPLLAVSLNINTTLHSPAQKGDVLRIVNTSVQIGNRAMTAKCEIWSGTHHRLVASGTHIKMAPSPPKTKL